MTAGRDIDDFEFEPRPLVSTAFELFSHRPPGSPLRSRHQRLAHMTEDSPAVPVTNGRVEGPGHAIGSHPEAPRPTVLHHECEGGECEMRDYSRPTFADGNPNSENTDDDQGSDDKEQAETDQ